MDLLFGRCDCLFLCTDFRLGTLAFIFYIRCCTQYFYFRNLVKISIMKDIILLQSKIINTLGNKILETSFQGNTPEKEELIKLLQELKTLSKTIE